MEIPFAFSRCYSSKLSVGTKPTMAASEKFVSHQYNGRVGVVVSNNSGSDIYWGGENVTADTGIPIKNGESICFPIADTYNEKSVYLIAAASADVSICEMTV